MSAVGSAFPSVNRTTRDGLATPGRASNSNLCRFASRPQLSTAGVWARHQRPSPQ
jgi:hypothetical protein